MLNFKNFERKLKSPFMIYANLGSISVPIDNGKQNPEDKYQNLLLIVMVINCYMLMINLVSLLSLT